MDEVPQKLGKGMITFAWIGALGVLTLFFNMLIDKQHNPNTDLSTELAEDGTHTVTLQRNHSGHYVANGEINGQKVRFLLDTGATIVSVPERISGKLGLERGIEIDTVTANGMTTTYSTTIEKIALGNITLHNVRASINPNMVGEEVLLGMSFLKDLEFTQRGNTLILKQY